MKICKRFLLLLAPVLFVLFLMGGCEQNKGALLAPDTEQAGIENNSQEINFVSLDIGKNAFAKGKNKKEISTKVTKKTGGQLVSILDGSKQKDKRFKNMSGIVTLDFPPQAVEKDVTVSLQVMDGFFMGFVELEYLPHGLIFNKPAILNINGYNLDLSSINADVVDSIELYYVKQKKGKKGKCKWIKMKCKEIFIDLETGTFRVVDGELPHFSRYAVAYSN